MTEPRIVLASQSPRRRELLQLLGVSFDVTVANVDESPRPNESPIRLVTRLSRAKAHGAPLDGHRDVLVIACDTTVALCRGGQPPSILGKPRDAHQAATMLRSLRGRSHTVHSAVTTLTPRGRTLTQVASTRLTMRQYTERELLAYVAGGDPLDKAGSYAIQHEGFRPVSQIDGCYASVMGLPLCHLHVSLRRLGRTPEADVPRACQAYTGHTCVVHQEIIRGR